MYGQGEQAWVGAGVRGQGMLEAMDCDFQSFHDAAIARERRARLPRPHSRRPAADLLFDHLFDRWFDFPVSLPVSL